MLASHRQEKREEPRDGGNLQGSNRMTTTADPLRDLLRLQERMNRLFEQTLRPGGSSEEEELQGGWAPPVDIEETGDRIVLRADLPGISLEQIDLKVQNGNLFLRGDRPFDSRSRREDYHRIERPFGKFFRSFALPPNIREDAIQAELRNGVLEVTLPKKTETQTKQIRVEVR